LAELNPEIIVESHECRLKSDNALKILAGYDVIVDGVDNIPTRYLLSDACEILSLPWVHASVFRFEGQLTTFNSAGGPNYRDLFPTPPPAGATPSCADAGVLGVLPGMMGVLQATEVVKLLLGIGTPMSGRLLLFDALRMSFRELSFAAAPGRSIATTLAIDSDYELTNCDSEETRTLQSKSGISDGPSRGDIADEGRDVRGRTGGKGMFGFGNKIGSLRPSEFVVKQDEGWNAFLLDVRGQIEANITSLAGTDLCVETRMVQAVLDEIPRDRDIVVYCRTGHRSKVIAKALVKWGWSHENVWNLAGGVHAWSDEIDSSVPKY
jgi:adenylyltransferase/sulfurtransferase